MAIFPNFHSMLNPRAMHAYHPDDPDQHGIFIAPPGRACGHNRRTGRCPQAVRAIVRPRARPCQPGPGGVMAKVAAVPGPIAARPLVGARRWDALRAVARGGSFVLGATLLWNALEFCLQCGRGPCARPGWIWPVGRRRCVAVRGQPRFCTRCRRRRAARAARLTSTDRDGDVRPQLRRQAWRAAGWTAFAVAVAALAAGQIAHALRLSSSIPVLLLLASMPLAAIVNLQRGAMQGIGRISSATPPQPRSRPVRRSSWRAHCCCSGRSVESAVLATAAALGCAALRIPGSSACSRRRRPLARGSGRGPQRRPGARLSRAAGRASLRRRNRCQARHGVPRLRRLRGRVARRQDRLLCHVGADLGAVSDAECA